MDYFIFNILTKSKEDINEIADSGMFNSIIEGYIRTVFAHFDLTDKLDGYNFNRMFDNISAAEARRMAEKGGSSV